MIRKTNIPEGSDLQKAADSLQSAALAYRAQFIKAFGDRAAMIWVECRSQGFCLAFTRGEYRRELQEFIEGLEEHPDVRKTVEQP